VEFTSELCYLQEIKSVERQITAVQQQHDQLIEHMKDKQNQLQQLQDATKQLDTELEERKLQRQRV
jgi:chromosome segregation ATPase